MKDSSPHSRRDLLAAAALSGGAAALFCNRAARAEDSRRDAPSDRPVSPHPLGDSAVVKNGRIHHSVCLWCYKGMKSTDMAPVARRLGLPAIDLLTPDQWGPLKENGLICSMTSGVWGGITRGLNRAEHHEAIIQSLTELCDANAREGYPNVICFSGNRDGQHDEDGLRICAEGIKKVIGHFESKKVTLCMELSELQGEPPGLPVRPHPLGRRAGQGGRVRAVPASLRHLPHADHGRGHYRARSARITSASPTTTPAACRAATRSTRPRSSTGPPS